MAKREGELATEIAAAAVADYVALDAEHVAEIEAALRGAKAEAGKRGADGCRFPR